MGLVTVVDEHQRYFVLACNTTGKAFGHLMYVPEEAGHVEHIAEDFVESIRCDPRTLSDGMLIQKWNDFYMQLMDYDPIEP